MTLSINGYRKITRLTILVTTRTKHTYFPGVQQPCSVEVTQYLFLASTGLQVGIGQYQPLGADMVKAHLHPGLGA